VGKDKRIMKVLLLIGAVRWRGWFYRSNPAVQQERNHIGEMNGSQKKWGKEGERVGVYFNTAFT